ncbi:sigma 54-interacting transcriptional regulator [Oleidesulfovibrio sp.]|uniref:sigma-54 interaction domain-containing protein n=1 Tax=Oleidesulfovibrio sp. TaxID=2909707 RepID=UPI003A8C3F6F
MTHVNDDTPELQQTAVPDERRATLAALELAATLSHFEQRLDRMDGVDAILGETATKVQGLVGMQAWSFFLVDEESGDFSCALASSPRDRTRFEREVDSLIEDKTFAWALGRNRAVVIPSTTGANNHLLLHPLATSSGLWGMFAGIPQKDAESSDMGFYLLTVVFFSCASMLESYTLYRRLQHANEGLEQQVAERTSALVEANTSLAHEVEERRQAEKNLRKTLGEKESYRQHLEAVFSSIKDAIISVDLSGVVVNLNAAAEEMLQRNAEGVVGLHYTELQPACSNAFHDVLASTLASGTPVREFRAVSEDGAHVMILGSTPLISLDDEFSGAVLSGRDITRLATLEEQLRERHSFSNLIGRSKVMQSMFGLLENLAAYDTTVLVTGESGTGKELVAEALHYNGARSGGPLVKVNCTALSESLLESELFGHVRGAFTGAVRDRAGRFETAEGGTIFLDEIGDISMRIQVLLLRFLESKEFERVGDTKPRRADVRIVAATNADLGRRIQEGTFRADLFYRLNVTNIHLPPLRERREDIPLLVQHFTERCNRELGTQVGGVDEGAMAALVSAPWPGNVRELKHTLEHACVLCRQGYISPAHLPAELMQVPSAQMAAGRDRGQVPDMVLADSSGSGNGTVPTATPAGQNAVNFIVPSGFGRKKLDEATIRDAINQAGGNKALAARMLGVGRATLYRKMQALKIS